MILRPRPPARRGERIRNVVVGFAVLITLSVLFVSLMGSDQHRPPPPRDAPRRHPEPSIATEPSTRAAWRASTQGGPGRLAADGDAVVVAARDEVRLLDASTGRLQWRVPIAGLERVRPALDASTVLVATRTAVVAFERPNGDARWSTPIADVGELLLAAGDAQGAIGVLSTIDGRIVGLDATTGVARWAVHLPGAHQRPPGLGLAGSVLIVTAWLEDAPMVVGLDVLTGTARWSDPPRAGLARPATAGDVVMVADGDEHGGRLRLLAAADGSVRWSAELPTAFGPGLEPALDERVAVVVDLGGVVHALDAASGEPLGHVRTELAPLFETRVLLSGGSAAFVVAATVDVSWRVTPALGQLRLVPSAGIVQDAVLGAGGVVQLLTPRAGPSADVRTSGWVQAMGEG